MLLASGENRERVRAQPGARASCPECDERVVAKCGEIITWHWAHKPSETRCDYQGGETEWHLSWKEWAYERGCLIEQRMVEGFRADIVTPRGRIVELQSRAPSAETIFAREEAYGHDLVWLILVTENQEDRIRWGEQFYGRGGHGFFWKQGPKRLTLCNAPIYLDLGESIWEVKRISLDERYNDRWGTTNERVTGWAQPIDVYSLFQVPDEALKWGKHDYCQQHNSFFCPNVAPWLYRNDITKAAVWSPC